MLSTFCSRNIQSRVRHVQHMTTHCLSRQYRCVFQYNTVHTAALSSTRLAPSCHRSLASCARSTHFQLSSRRRSVPTVLTQITSTRHLTVHQYRLFSNTRVLLSNTTSEAGAEPSNAGPKAGGVTGTDTDSDSVPKLGVELTFGDGSFSVHASAIGTNKKVFMESQDIPLQRPNFSLQVEYAGDGLDVDNKCGEDALVVSESSSNNNVFLGVADGVGGYQSSGIDSGILSHRLMQLVREHGSDASGKTYSDALTLLQDAFDQLQIERESLAGAATTCLSLFRPVNSKSQGTTTTKEVEMSTINAGDSGAIVLRNGRVVFQTEEVMHTENMSAMVLCWVPFRRLPPLQLGVGGEHSSADTPAEGNLTTFRLQHGDMIVLGSDGLWDNVPPSEAAFVARTLERAMAQQGRPGDMAFNLSRCLFRRALHGGKLDDITVVAGMVQIPQSDKASSTPSQEIAARDALHSSFYATHLQVGQVVSAEKHPDADKLIVQKIDIGGDEPMQVCSGIAGAYAPEDLPGRKVIVVTNLKKSRMRGVDSFGMILAAFDEVDGTIALVSPPENSTTGTRIILSNTDTAGMADSVPLAKNINLRKSSNPWLTVAPQLRTDASGNVVLGDSQFVVDNVACTATLTNARVS
jgi:methionine--tRNA ligase beta chain